MTERPTAPWYPLPNRTAGSIPTSRSAPPNDYATSTGVADFRMDCTCGSALCRGVVTGLDWQRGELQERYGEHWTPGLLKLIRGR